VRSAGAEAPAALLYVQAVRALDEGAGVVCQGPGRPAWLRDDPRARRDGVCAATPEDPGRPLPVRVDDDAFRRLASDERFGYDAFSSPCPGLRALQRYQTVVVAGDAADPAALLGRLLLPAADPAPVERRGFAFTLAPWPPDVEAALAEPGADPDERLLLALRPGPGLAIVRVADLVAGPRDAPSAALLLVAPGAGLAAEQGLVVPRPAPARPRPATPEGEVRLGTARLDRPSQALHEERA